MSTFGWDLPPGCTQRDIDEQAGADIPDYCFECGRDIGQHYEDLYEKEGDEAADAMIDRFLQQHARCDMCWEGYQSRGITVCRECNHPVAINLMEHATACPPCLKNIEAEIAWEKEMGEAEAQMSDLKESLKIQLESMVEETVEFDLRDMR